MKKTPLMNPLNHQEAVNNILISSGDKELSFFTLGLMIDRCSIP